VAASAGACASDWTGGFTGLGITSTGCSASGSNADCSFSYYTLTPLGQLLFGTTGTNSLTATLQADAPHAAASFRPPLQSAQVTVAPGFATTNFSFAPETDGDAHLSLDVQVPGTNLCRDDLLGGLTCLTAFLLGLATNSDVTVSFPQLAAPVLQGTKLSAGALQGHTPPYNFDLLSPAPGDPHYWFMRNEWYRYTYYAVAPSATAAASPGTLTVNGFPPANGSTSDKRFVLALMGPAVTGQVRGPAAALSHYVEGPNAATTASPRAFAYQVYALAGNDRIATCPYADGATPCD